MSRYFENYTSQIQDEIHRTPGEYLPALLELVRLFRQSVTLKPAQESFRQGWQEVLADETLPISDLWDDVDAE